MSMDSKYLDAIKGFEGYTPKATWDYKQNSVGYGTRARFPGEVISQDEAERRFQTEIANARSIVDRVAPQAPEGVKAALTSLTYNSGSDWVNAGLGQAVKAGDYGAAKDKFLQYTHAGGEVLPGLVTRRQNEAAWFDGPPGQSAQPPGEKPMLPALMALLGTGGTAAAGAGTAAAASPIDSFVNSLFGGGQGAPSSSGGGSPFGSLKIGSPEGGAKAPEAPDMSGAVLAGLNQPQQPMDINRLRDVISRRPTLGITRGMA